MEKELKLRAAPEKLPEHVQTFVQQFGDLLVSVTTTPVTRPEYGKAINRMFRIPEAAKKRGSRELPAIPTPENYIALLEKFRESLPRALPQWRNLENHIGELVTFHYGLENNARVAEAYPFLPEYQLKRRGNVAYVSLEAVKERLEGLVSDYQSHSARQSIAIAQVINE